MVMDQAMDTDLVMVMADTEVMDGKASNYFNKWIYIFLRFEKNFFYTKNKALCNI